MQGLLLSFLLLQHLSNVIVAAFVAGVKIATFVDDVGYIKDFNLFSENPHMLMVDQGSIGFLYISCVTILKSIMLQLPDALQCSYGKYPTNTTLLESSLYS